MVDDFSSYKNKKTPPDLTEASQSPPLGDLGGFTFLQNAYGNKEWFQFLYNNFPG